MRTVTERIERLEQVASSERVTLVSSLRSAFADPSPAVRGKAVLIATDQKLNELLPMVRRLLRDKNAEVRTDAAECIGVLKQGCNKSCPGLRARLSDESAVVRAQAAESIALVGDQGALPKVVRLLSDPEPFVRSYAATTIAELRGVRYIKRIHAALRDDKEERARVGLLGALIQLGERGALRELLSLLDSRDYRVRCSVANTVESICLNGSDTRLAVVALSMAARKALVFADRSTTNRVLRKLKKRAGGPGF